MEFISDYPDLCDQCQATVKAIAQLFREGVMPDTDDEEAPIMYVYDHGAMCGRFECISGLQAEKDRAAEIADQYTDVTNLAALLCQCDFGEGEYAVHPYGDTLVIDASNGYIHERLRLE